MLEQLQGSPINQMSGLLGPVLATWLVWPVLCGLLGARRGMAFQGAVHGLFWGPFALAYVLLAKERHVCPTCGKRTLTAPAARAVQTASPDSWSDGQPTPSAGPPREAGHDPLTIELGPPVGAERRRAPQPVSPEERERLIAAACSGYDEEEEARLRAWINGE